MTGNHESTDIGDEKEQKDDVAVDTVEDERVMTDPGDELGIAFIRHQSQVGVVHERSAYLKDQEEAQGNDAGEMEGDADSLVAVAEVVPF